MTLAEKCAERLRETHRMPYPTKRQEIDSALAALVEVAGRAATPRSIGRDAWSVGDVGIAAALRDLAAALGVTE